MWKFEDIFIDDTRNVERVSVKEYLENGKIAIIDQGKEKIIGYTNCEDYKVCKEERIIFGDHTRTFKYINIPFITGADGTKVLKLKDLSKYHYKYFYYYLLHSYIPDTGYNRHFKWVKELCFDIPELKEQIEIATKLDKIQDIIDVRKKQIEDLEGLIKSQFVEMFGDVKKNDKKWKYTTIGKECFFNPKKSELQNLSENFEVSFVAMPSVSENGNIDTSIIRKYDEVKKSFTYFAENDVLFAKITPCMENGKGAVAVGLKNKVGFGSTEFHVLRPKENINSIWLYTLTAMKSFRIEAERKMTGSAGQKRVPVSFFETYGLGLPPIELQNKFAEFVKLINKQKFEIEKSLKEMQELYESLMEKYFG